MEGPFSWRNYRRWSETLQSLGFIALIIGPLIGFAMLVFGGLWMKAAGVFVIFSSMMVCLYHVSFCMLMNAVEALHDLIITGQDAEESEADEAAA